jgi:hypothetical protein
MLLNIALSNEYLLVIIDKITMRHMNNLFRIYMCKPHGRNKLHKFILLSKSNIATFEKQSVD